MGYKDYFIPKVKWAKASFKDLPDTSDDGVDGDSDTSTLLGEKPKPQSKLRRHSGRLFWLLHLTILTVNITWWLTWNSWMHPADNFSISTPYPSCPKIAT